MDEKEAIQLIQKLRHDWMNDLQLILGYIQLGKPEKAEEKIAAIIEMAGKSRALDRLHLPKTTILLLLLNAENTHFQWEWEVDDTEIEGDYYPNDEELKHQLVSIYKIVEEHLVDYEVYHAKLSIQKKEEKWAFLLTIKEVLDNTDELVEKIKKLSFVENITTTDNFQLQWK